jgi:ligand-binding sensor domain-containing protein
MIPIAPSQLAIAAVLVAAIGASGGQAQEPGSTPLPFPLVERFESFGPEQGLPSWKVNCMLARGGTVWAGTDRGLVTLAEGRWKPVDIGEDPARKVVISLAENPSTGEIWAGTFQGVVRVSAGRVDSFTQLNSGLPNDVVYGVVAAPDAAWFATAAGLGRLDAKTGAWSLFDHTNAQMHEPWCYAVTLSPRALYVGVWGGGVVERDVAEGTWKEHRDPDGEMEIDLLADDGPIHDVTSGVAWSAGLLWQATYFGLARHDGSRWRSWVAEKSPLPSNFINFVEARGRVAWLATDVGLCVTDGDTWGTWRRLDDGAGEVELHQPREPVRVRRLATALPHNEVLGVSVTEREVWLGTSRGVARGVFAPTASTPKGKKASERR